MSNVLVVGDGPAAQRLVDRTRHHGFESTVTVLGTGPATVVAAVDRERHRVLAHVNGAPTTYSYDTLVLATEARPLIPDIPGLVDPEGRLTGGVVAPGPAAGTVPLTGETAVVLGEGPLAVETAASLAARGVGTTLVCATLHPLYARLGETCSGMLSERLERAGVAVLGGRTAIGRLPGRLRLDDGTALRADTVVLCAGTAPDTRLARASGLDVRVGTVVDDRLRTSDPRVHAIGDSTAYDGRLADGPNVAWEQAEALAEILAGHAVTYRPRPSALRLRTDVADVVTIGSLADLHRPGTRQISLTDRANRRYVRLALRDERVVAAVLFGLPQAIATIGLLHRRGQRLPSDRLGLLLDLPPGPASGSATGDKNAPVCLCGNICEQTLLKAWRAGSRTVTALAKATRATTGCGGCTGSVEELCRVWARASRQEMEKAS
ncbi:FAD-dependent oxidoreductase [Streptomyces mirabilis]|uniref:FAD-dependent oxidoreductase n=1 Tax=Streptomyces mirabilis TaxID=68239 RepID=UPI00381ED9B5